MDQPRRGGARAGRWGTYPSPREPRELAVPGQDTRVPSGLPCVRGELGQLCRTREPGGLQVLSISPGDGSPGPRRALAGGCELESPRQRNPDGHGQGHSSEHVHVSARQQGWGRGLHRTAQRRLRGVPAAGERSEDAALGGSPRTKPPRALQPNHRQQEQIEEEEFAPASCRGGGIRRHPSAQRQGRRAANALRDVVLAAARDSRVQHCSAGTPGPASSATN